MDAETGELTKRFLKEHFERQERMKKQEEEQMKEEHEQFEEEYAEQQDGYEIRGQYRRKLKILKNLIKMLLDDDIVNVADMKHVLEIIEIVKQSSAKPIVSYVLKNVEANEELKKEVAFVGQFCYEQILKAMQPEEEDEREELSAELACRVLARFELDPIQGLHIPFVYKRADSALDQHRKTIFELFYKGVCKRVESRPDEETFLSVCEEVYAGRTLNTVMVAF